MRYPIVLLSFILTLTAKSAEDPATLTLDRIFKDKEFTSKSFSANWRALSGGYTHIKTVDDREDIWLSLPAVNTSTVLVKASELIPFGTETPLSIDDYAFSKDTSLLLIYTNSKRVWRRNTRGDYWILDRASGELRQLGGDAPPSSLMFAKISPTGTHVAYVSNLNIHVEDLTTHSIHTLTKTDSEHIINGTSDWVYEEELGVRDGFRWSPDGQSIAYWQFDESEVRRYTMVDHVSGLYPKLKSFGYPKVGQRNATCRIGVIDVNSTTTRWIDVPGAPQDNYIARMDWAANSKELVIQQLNRAQNTNLVMLANTTNQSVKTILTEREDTWVDVHDELHWVRDGKAFTWISERDGWRHLYLASRDGNEITCLTKGDFDVIRLLTVDDSDQWAYFIASPDNPAQRFLYRVRLDGSGLTRLTPADQVRGSHAYSISPNGQFAVWTYSNFDEPPVTRLIELPAHQVLEVLEANTDLHEKVTALDRTPVEFFYVDIGEDKALHARCIKPPGFNPKLTYPLWIHVYGEPAGQVVTDRWGGNTHLWHLMLAQQGYVILSVDNRGTAAPRGREFRRAAFHKIGILAPQDQAAAVRVILKERSYLDPKRVGTWGWSGGGSMSLNAIFKFPELYQTAIAIASVPNQRFYDTIYQERYMGLPADNVEGYRQGSPIHFADQLEGNLLIVHGAADDNCHYQTFEKLVDRLVRHNKEFTMMTYPRGTHSIKEGKNTTLHLFSLMTRFLKQHLPTQP